MGSAPPGRSSKIEYKKMNELIVASVGSRGTYHDTPQQLMPKFKVLAQMCGERISGPPMALYDYGVYSDAVHIDVCYPVAQVVESDDVICQVLDAVEVLSIIHHGSYAEMGESYKKLYGYMREHEIAPAAYGREVYLECDTGNDGKNITELQVVLHKWEDRFAKNVERVLGVAARNTVMRDSEKLYTIESTGADKAKWLKSAMETLDGLADEDQKFEILSCCAHEFSGKRIAQLRAIYASTGDIDAVLKHMNEDPDWYEKPTRKGQVIYVCKVPYDVKGYENAKTEAEKKKSYCHCMLVRKHLDENISPTFCYCGTGWYRQYWEGILGKPVKIEVLRSLLKGDEKCEVAIHLDL
jgi:effector-binding domain-containing protein